MAIMVEEIPAVLLRLKPMFLWLNTELTNVVVKEAEPATTLEKLVITHQLILDKFNKNTNRCPKGEKESRSWTRAWSVLSTVKQTFTCRNTAVLFTL